MANRNTAIIFFSSWPAETRDSGSKCKKAPPIKVPAENATKKSSILFNTFSLRKSVKAPTKEIRLIRKVAMIIKNRVYIIDKKNYLNYEIVKSQRLKICFKNFLV